MIYEIYRYETLGRCVYVKAESESEALDIADRYFSIPGNEIDYSDYEDTDTQVLGISPDSRGDRYDEVITEEDV